MTHQTVLDHVSTHIYFDCPVNIVQGEKLLKPEHYLQVNALSEWIIEIYLHEFTNNEREISIPHEAAECGIKKFWVHC